MYQTCISNDKEESYHLVNQFETPHRFYLLEMLNAIGVNQVEMLDYIPDNLTQLEDFYFRTVGKIFTPYISFNEMKFDTENLKSVYKNNNLFCPEINKDNFSKLMQYAKMKHFGLAVDKKVDSISLENRLGFSLDKIFIPNIFSTLSDDITSITAKI
jgi:hypothetical protein